MEPTTNTPAEAVLDDRRNVLVVLSPTDDEVLRRDFFGAVYRLDDPSVPPPDFTGKTVYLCGDLARARGLDLDAAERVMALRERCTAMPEGDTPWTVVGVGRAPLRVHGLGVLYRRFFDEGSAYFARVCAEHAFQTLTESTKPVAARRTGVYLTPVAKDGDALRFHLLRCSTNLSGPTENFRAGDTEIVGALNREAERVFRGHSPLNHVLAQVYHNHAAQPDRRASKATISAHADKTKDMPSQGVMAFCTFYDGLDRLRPMASDPFDLGHKSASGLSRLRFRRKAPGGAGPAHFTVTLYPDSVFFMPLSTNRLYTHELQPSALDVEHLPTRLGYVVRCSKTEALHRDGQTFLLREEGPVALEPPTPEAMDALRRLYAEENRSAGFIDYGERFLFSMNRGDYTAPRL